MQGDKCMNNNVGKDDRIVRILIGLGFISMVFVGPETQWGWFGLIPLATALVGFCPLYMKLGLDTSDKKEEAEQNEVVEKAPEKNAPPTSEGAA